MNYVLKGHEYRHAVEEMLVHLLPADEIPARVDALAGDGCVSILEERDGVVRAVARVTRDGAAHEASRTAEVAGTDALERRRRESEAVRLSLYEAVLPLLSRPPVWGSLTGVRPAKLARCLIARGASNAEAARALRERYAVQTERAALAVRCAAVAEDAARSFEPRDVSLYIGIPFCPSRCAYCSFVSATVERAAALIPPYVDALCAEVELTGRLLREGGWRVVSVYIGGGTPTTLDESQLARLMESLQNAVDLRALREYTVEAGRPDTITEAKLRALRAGGVNRVSINPQSMDDEVLRRASRRHSAAQVLESYELARRVGFSCINMDTIAGLDGDTPESFARTIDTLVGLAPENLTVHTLAIKRAADLGDRAAAAGARDAVAAMLDGARDRLTAAGYAPYYLYRQKFTAGGIENTGWTKPGHECLYNIAMMEELQTIVSLGAGAVSKRVQPGGRITRYANPKYPAEYLAAGDRIAAARAKLLIPEQGREENL